MTTQPRDSSSNESDPLSVNPKIKALVKIHQDGPFVELKGFIGPSDDSQIVRLHRALDAGDYIDIPRDAIRLADGGMDRGTDCMVRLLVVASAKVTHVVIDQGAASDMDQKVAGRFKVPTNTLEPTCDLIKQIIPVYEKAIRDGYIRLPGGGLLRLSPAQIAWLKGELHSLQELSDKLLCDLV